MAALLVFFSSVCLWADTGGSISGTVKDPSGGVIPDAAIIARNIDGGVQQTLNTNAAGFYAFTTLPVGHYEIEAFRPGFKTYKRTGLVIEVGTALQVDLTMEIGEGSQEMTVTAIATSMETTPETISTHLGEVVPAKQVEAIPLNGRSYTDLLAIQPGVSPVTTLTPTSVIMAGVTGTINPSGDANPGRRFDRWPARVRERIHGEWHRRAGAHERRNVGHPESGFDRGVSCSHE